MICNKKLNYLNKLIHIIITIKIIKLMYVTPLKLNLEKYNEKYFQDNLVPDMKWINN